MADFKAVVSAKAAAQGLVPVFADDNTLLVDIDSQADFGAISVRLALCQKPVQFMRVSYTLSKSKHWHVYVTLASPLTAPERYLLQSILGSDPIREALNYRTFKQTGVDECVLFELPGATHTTLTVPPFPKEST